MRAERDLLADPMDGDAPLGVTRAHSPRAHIRAPEPRRGYVSLFWRLLIPKATVLTVAGAVLLLEPADGRFLILTAGPAFLESPRF